MAKIELRPDLKTAGGEIHDILVSGRYVGGVTVVYREGSRLAGAIQLEKSSLAPAQKRHVIRFVEEYIEAMAAALDADECDVVVTYSHFDQVIISEQNMGEIEYVIDESELDEEVAAMDSGDTMDRGVASNRGDAMNRGVASNRGDAMDRGAATNRSSDNHEQQEAADAELYELVITGEHGDSIEYHVYGRHQQWLAEAFITLYGADAIGEINWIKRPSSEQIEHVVDLLVSDFDDDLIDSFQLEIKHNGELLEVFELDHQDLVEDLNDKQDIMRLAEDDYSVHLVRDDVDTLTYDIYERGSGAVPIGVATIDISGRKVTGYMDFRETRTEEERERIASLLMKELDKEIQFETFNLTVLYRNRPIDELLFENVPLQ